MKMFYFVIKDFFLNKIIHYVFRRSKIKRSQGKRNKETFCTILSPKFCIAAHRSMTLKCWKRVLSRMGERGARFSESAVALLKIDAILVCACALDAFKHSFGRQKRQTVSE